MPFFRDIASATLRRLAPLFSTQLAKRGTHIIREGEEGSVLYVLAQGAASIQKWSSDRKLFVEVAKIDDDSEHTYFGALGLLFNACNPTCYRHSTGCDPMYPR